MRPLVCGIGKSNSLGYQTRFNCMISVVTVAIKVEIHFALRKLMFRGVIEWLHLVAVIWISRKTSQLL